MGQGLVGGVAIPPVPSPDGNPSQTLCFSAPGPGIGHPGRISVHVWRGPHTGAGRLGRNGNERWSRNPQVPCKGGGREGWREEGTEEG